MSLTVVGSVAFDAIETPYGKTDKIIGGAGTYIGLSASYFVEDAGVIAVVGDDFPKEYIKLLEEHKIDLKGLQVKSDEKTFFWSGKYHQNMNQRDTLVTELNVLENFDPIVPSEYQNTDYLMLGNLSPIVQRTVIERLEEKPKLIVMDTMNFWMDIMMDELLKTIKLVDVLCINDEEARQLSGEYSIVAAAKKIQTMGPKYLIIKRGEHGAFLFGAEGEVFYSPASVVENVIDPTGAGDTFVGGFIGYIAQKDNAAWEVMKSAVVAGSAMASFTIEKFGTDGVQFISNDDVMRRMNDFVPLTSFNLD